MKLNAILVIFTLRKFHSIILLVVGDYSTFNCSGRSKDLFPIQGETCYQNLTALLSSVFCHKRTSASTVWNHYYLSLSHQSIVSLFLQNAGSTFLTLCLKRYNGKTFLHKHAHMFTDTHPHATHITYCSQQFIGTTVCWVVVHGVPVLGRRNIFRWAFICLREKINRSSVMPLTGEFQ